MTLGFTYQGSSARIVFGNGASAHAADHIEALGCRRALVLSVAYLYGSPARSVADEYTQVRAENDWTGAQAPRPNP